MNLFWIEFLGYAAGILTVLNMMPQLLKTYKTKEANDVSWLLIITYSLSMFMWVVYAIFIKSWPIIITNGISFVFSLLQLYLMLKYRK